MTVLKGVSAGSGTGSGTRTIPKAKKPPTKPPTGPPPANRQSQVLVFYGYQNDVLIHDFSVLCGANPPTITGGYANVQSISRPRSLGYSMASGYDPITMDVQIQFENWVTSSQPTNSDLEEDIRKLTWMAGRGKLGPGTSAQGDPPIVKVRAFNTGANDIPLIPPDVKGYEWIISGLSWDTSPLRLTSEMIAARGLSVPVGTRARQIATVTFTQWIPAPGFATKKKKPDNGNFAEFSSAAYHNIKLMTARYTGKNTQSAYKTVMDLGANKHLKLRNPRQELKNHTKVFFPNALRSG